MEPENIWLIGTTHLSQDSAADVERVVRAIKPDNVVVELCRSRQACFPFLFLLIFLSWLISNQFNTMYVCVHSTI